MSAGFWKKFPLVRGCPRGVHLVSLNVADVVRVCPRGEKTAARPFGLSAVVRAVSKYVIHVCPRTYVCFLCFS